MPKACLTDKEDNMGRCSNAELMKKIGVKKLDKSVEVTFDVHRDLPDCRKINTKDYINSISGGTYNKYKRPENQFECLREGCVTSGVLTIPSTQTAQYKAQYDATEFANGVVTFYVYPGSTELPATVTLTISDDANFTNADVYTVNVTQAMVGEDGFAAIMILLQSDPTSTTGDGWTPSASGAYIQLNSNKTIGFSTIDIYESIYDFEIDDVVKVGCLTSMGGSFDIEAIEATCLSSGYNTDLGSLSFPVTGNTVTSNYHLLNPLNGKGSSETGYDLVTVRKTVAVDGTVVLSDAAQDECGNIAVQIADACDTSELKRLSIPNQVALDEGHYQVVKNNDGTSTLYFNTALAGTDVLISYPRTIAVEEWVGNAENLGSVRVRMTVPLETTDGRHEVHVFNNVLITGFPMSFTQEETEFAFTITIQKDKDGDFYHIYRQVA